jgi:hypothetical protein
MGGKLCSWVEAKLQIVQLALPQPRAVAAGLGLEPAGQRIGSLCALRQSSTAHVL